MTVPNGAKNGILILCGSFWNNYLVNFSEPSGDGIVSAVKFYEGYSNNSTSNVYANIHIVIYTVAIKSGGTITATNSFVTEPNVNSDTMSSTSMVLLY